MDPSTSGTTSSRSDAPRTATVAAVVAVDDRPLIRAGLRAVLGDAEGITIREICTLETVGIAVAARQPDVLVTVVRDADADPFRLVATLKALHRHLKVLVVADGASVVDLREAVIAGVDSFLLTSADEDAIRDAVRETATGQRVLSPEVAMQLAGSWRQGTPEERTTALTPRELEVLQLVAEGMTNSEVGERLSLSARTVKTHVQNVLGKLEAPDRTGAVARALRLGLIR